MENNKKTDENFEIVQGVPLCYVKKGNGKHNILLIPGALGEYHKVKYFFKVFFTLVSPNPRSFAYALSVLAKISLTYFCVWFFMIPVFYYFFKLK